MQALARPRHFDLAYHMPLQFANPRPTPLGGGKLGGNKKQRGKYTKVKPIGKGAFGDVFLVSTPNEPEQLVLKEVSLANMGAVERKSTMNEVNILKKLNHPHIIAFKESFVVDQTLCVVMEFAADGDLAGLIEKQKKTGRRFPEATVLRLLAEVVSAMGYCHHELHLLHRDLKPQNIFLGKGGAVKLGDFGISKIMAASRAMAQTQCGTPLYMSPELCKGARYDRGADVWSVGCVLYEIMALAPPWMDKMNAPGVPGGISGLMKVITTSTLNLAPLRAHYSQELCSLLNSLLAKAASARPALNSVLASPLMQKALPTPPPPAPPSSASPSTPSTARGVRPSTSGRYGAGSIVMVKRTSGAETMAIVDKVDSTSKLYCLSLLSMDGKVEGSKQAPEPDLREPTSPGEKQMMALQQQRRQHAAPTPFFGGIDEHAAAQVLQSFVLQKRQAAQKPATAPAARPSTSSRYGAGTIVMVKRTSGAETMAVVDKIDATSNVYTLSLLSMDGKVEGSKQAPEPDLREPSTQLERVRQQQLQMRRAANAAPKLKGIDEHAAAAVLQRSFQNRRAAANGPPVLKGAPPALDGLANKGRQLAAQMALQQAARGRTPEYWPNYGGAQNGARPESLKEQQRRLAAGAQHVANGYQAGRAGAGPPGGHIVRAPFKPLL